MASQRSTTLDRQTDTRRPRGWAWLPMAFALVALSAGSLTVARFSDDAAAATTRYYYIAAEEVDWDYAPLGYNNITGEDFGPSENVFVGSARDRIGSVYRKALYVAYRDASFDTPIPVSPEWQHLGTLGPVIRAEVGDTIVVTFRNNTSIPNSMHPHGVFYEKESEGAPYNDGEGINAGDAVPPGGTHTYTWEVPERAGPGPHDPSSVLWMYHSHVDEAGDTNAGLIGPIIVTRDGWGDADAKPVDVDREFVTLFAVFDENRSPYLDYNIAQLRGANASVRESEEFIESNLMHAINGYVYGNLPGLTMKVDEQVRWYTLGMGTEVDLHTPHWHGQSLTLAGMRTDVAELLPGSMKTLDMETDNPGTWLFHCHVNDHIDAGMLALFTVEP